MDDRENDVEYVRWAKRVKIAAGFACEICSARGVYLESHHKNAWASYPEERYLPENGVSLCRSCHHLFHSFYEKGKNTEFQYNEFVEIYKLLKKVAEKELADNNKV